MAYFRIEGPGATPTIIEAANWMAAIARYSVLREFTGWAGDTPLGIVEVSSRGTAPVGTALVFSEDLFRIAERMLAAKTPYAGGPGRAQDTRCTVGAGAEERAGSRENLVQALIDFSTRRLKDARECSSSPTTRIAAAFDSGYAALLAIARRQGLPETAKHPSEEALKAAARAGGLEERDIALGLRLLRWVEVERYEEPDTLPASVPAAIEWAERVRVLHGN